MRILLVDDDIELADMLGSYLEREACLVQKVSDGTSAVVQALSGQFDLMVLDVMMPGISGVEVLRRVREHSMLPMLMLTARGDDTDRVLGLELGADDYVPLHAARAAGTHSRHPAPHGNQAQPAHEIDMLREGPLTMWPGERRAQWGDTVLELTSTEYSLLELLVRHAGQPVGKDVLSKQALGRPLARFDRSVDVHMSSIRQKLSRVAPGRICIQTVVRRGYQFIKA
jgi:DNA-binding response OmpR family regulator